MKSRAEQLDEMSKAILVATDRIRYYKQQDKMLQSEIKRLTRNERTHRLCTRGGMIEAFIPSIGTIKVKRRSGGTAGKSLPMLSWNGTTGRNVSISVLSSDRALTWLRQFISVPL